MSREPRAAKTRITPREAVTEILARVGPMPVECIPLREARDRILAVDVTSVLDLPPWDNAAMDGYAARRADLADAEVALRVTEEIAAGSFPSKQLGAGECARVFTGAPVPEGTDTVIRQEDVTVLPDGRVHIDQRRDVGHNVRPRGEDVKRGDKVFTPRTRLTPARLGVLAALAVNEVYVHRRPRVAYLTTGDELVDVDEREAIVSGKKIASSNSYTLDALIRDAGAEPVDLGIARDDPDDLRERLSKLTLVDLLVTSAGMSVGERDYLRQILEQGAAEMVFWRVRMRPGAPVGFALLEQVPWIGLPGNPVSTMVTFELFVRPAIRAMLGYERRFPRAVTVRVVEPITLKPKLQHFLRVTLTREDDDLLARFTGPQGSGILSSMARADALLIVPEDTNEIRPGDLATAIRLDEPEYVIEPPF